MRSMIACAALCALLAGGCATGNERRGASVEKAESRVLPEAYAHILRRFVAQATESGVTLPREVLSPHYVVHEIEALKERFPTLFLVTADQEAAFEAGTFDDEANRKSMEQSIQWLKENGVDLPSISIFLIRMLQENELEGARLEFAARLFACQAPKAGPE
jgi:hypothetical protein